LRKDPSIVELLSWLRGQLGDQFVVTDHWEADLYAIGISGIEKPTALAYVSTYGRAEGKYFLDLEIVHASQPAGPGQAIEQYESITRDELLSALSRHFGIPR
jgi:hypothetical protein